MKYNFILLFFVLSSCAAEPKLKKCSSELIIRSNQDFKTWFNIHDDRYFLVKLKNKKTLESTFLLKKLFNKLFLVESKDSGKIINYFPILDNRMRKETVNTVVNDIFPKPNVMQKNLSVKTWFNDKQDTLDIFFSYEHHFPSSHNKSDYINHLRMSFETGNIELYLNENVTSLW